MNKKGFTLIELIATIVIISILTLVAVVSVSSVMKKTTERAYQNIEDAMQTAAQNYILKGNGIGVITSETLVDSGFLEKPKDPKTKKVCSLKKSYVNVSKEEVSGTVNEKYNYNVCLVCEDYKSEYCKDKTTIKLSYRYSEDEDSVNNYKKINGTISMKPGSNIQVKYEIEFETENNIKLEFEDSDCEDAYQKIESSNNTFRIINMKELDKECSVKVWDTSDESVLEPSYFTIRNESIGNDSSSSSRNELKMYIGGFANVGNQDSYNSSVIKFNKFEQKFLKFRLLNSNGEVVQEDTKNLQFKLINNIVVVHKDVESTGPAGTVVNILGSYKSYDDLKKYHTTGNIGDSYLVNKDLYVWSDKKNDWIKVDKKFNCFAIKPYNGSYVWENSIKGFPEYVDDELDNTKIYLKNITDGCDNVKLRVSDNEGNKIKDYTLDYPNYKHITYFSVDEKYVEIDGKYNDTSPVSESYYIQKIYYEPQDADNNNFICEVINEEKYNDSVSCKIITNGKEKSLKIMGGIKPLASDDYVTVKLSTEDANSNVKPINIRVKVNNVVPTSVSVSYHGGTQFGGLYYMCAGYRQMNVIDYYITPSNAMVSSSIIELSRPIQEKLYNPCTIPTSSSSPSFNNGSKCYVNINVTVYNSYGGETKSVSRTIENAVVYPKGYTLFSRKYCN